MKDKYVELDNALKEMCENCESLLAQIPSNVRPEDGDIHSCGHKMCPFRVIDNDYCPNYTSIKNALEKYKILDKQNTPKYPKVFSCAETRYEPAEYDCDCPSCGSSLLHDGDGEWDYCPYCGQAIKYESEDY